MNRTIQWLAIIAWTALLSLTIYNSWRIPNNLIVEGVDVTSDLVHRQNVIYVWIAVGLITAAIALRFDRWWRVADAVSALTYLVGWYFRGPMASAGPIDGYKLLWKTATELHLLVPFLVRDVFVPGVLLVVLAGTIAARWKQGSLQQI